MKKLLLITLVAGGWHLLQPRVPMRKCTFRLGSGRATTGITRTVTITRTAITSRTMGYYYRPYYWSGGHRYYRHHRYHHNYRY
jgi:hypothetical protein